MSAQDINSGRIAGAQKTSAQNVGSHSPENKLAQEGTQEIEISGKDSHTRLIETSENDQVIIGSQQQAQLQVSAQQYRVNKDQA